MPRLVQPLTLLPFLVKWQVTPPLKLEVVTLIHRHDALEQEPLPVLHERSPQVEPLPTVTFGCGGDTVVALP